VDTQQPRQIHMFSGEVPVDVPQEAIRYWQAHHRWFVDAGKLESPTREEFAERFKPPISTSKLDRIRQGNGKYANVPKYLGHWPPRREDRPPWETSVDGLVPVETQELNVIQEIHTLRNVVVAGFEGGKVVRVVQLHDALTGQLVHSYLEPEPPSPTAPDSHGLAVLAAGLSGFGLLDFISDGRLDGVVRICHFLAPQFLRG
jgi:hypothetical protein